LRVIARISKGAFFEQRIDQRTTLFACGAGNQECRHSFGLGRLDYCDGCRTGDQRQLVTIYRRSNITRFAVHTFIVKDGNFRPSIIFRSWTRRLKAYSVVDW
jgi:hypothetical protein